MSTGDLVGRPAPTEAGARVTPLLVPAASLAPPALDGWFPVPVGALAAIALAGYLAYRGLRALRTWGRAAPAGRPEDGSAPAVPDLEATTVVAKSADVARRARRFGALFVAAFFAAVVPLLYFHVPVLRTVGRAVTVVGRWLAWPRPWPGFVPKATLDGFLSDYIFLVYLAFLAAFCVASGVVVRPGFSAKARTRALLLLVGYVTVELLLDSFFFTVPGRFVASSFLLLRALNGGVFVALLVASTIEGPPPVAVDPAFPRDRRTVPTFLLTAGIAVGLSIALLYLLFRYAGLGREVLPLAVLLLLPMSALTIWGALGRVVYDLGLVVRPRASLAEHHPPVTVLVPAFNEEANIADCVRGLDAAAALYPGSTEILVANDGSTDGTSGRAAEAVAALARARGRILDLPHRGKAGALNAALAEATGDVIVRVDADARVAAETGFSELVPHFADAEVGAVQGLILPRQDRGWTRKLRLLEVAWSHLYLRRGLMAMRSADVVDGVFAAYRRRDLVASGGFAPWNGEDAEVTLRLERQGFRLRLEPGARAYEDVPADLRAFRRQRLRWNRGGLFAHRRHAGAVTGPGLAFGGLAILVWFLRYARGGLRTLVWGFAVASTFLLGLPTLLHVAVIAALLLVPRGVAVGYYLGRLGRLRDLPYLLAWPVFAGVKQYVALESLGSMLPGSPPELVE